MNAYFAEANGQLGGDPEPRATGEPRYRLLVDNMEEGVVFHDELGVIRSCNPSAERILQVSANRLLGRRSVLELCDPVKEDGAAFSLDQCPALESLRTGRSQHGVVIGIRRPSGTHWIALTSHPLSTAEGHRAGVVTSFRDITALRERERQQASRTREAYNSVRLHDEFLATAAHELRTPLTALQLQMQTLLRGARNAPVPAGDPLHPKLMAGLRQTERLSTLIDLLLDVSQMTTGRLELKRARMNLAQLVQDVVARHADAIAAANVTVTLELQPVFGAWDASRLDQVVSNLLSNALKYGRGEPVVISVRESDGVALLSVKDGGLGIAPEHQARIFERFERAHPDAGKSGLGLGLWIMREIVEAHRGRVELASELGQGSTFTIHLPPEHGTLTP